MCMRLNSLTSMDQPCTFGPAVCHLAPSFPLNTQLRAGQYALSELMV